MYFSREVRLVVVFLGEFPGSLPFPFDRRVAVHRHHLQFFLDAVVGADRLEESGLGLFLVDLMLEELLFLLVLPIFHVHALKLGNGLGTGAQSGCREGL